jgi:hypothetical protein
MSCEAASSLATLWGKRTYSLAGTRGTEHEDTTGRLDADALEELRMTERELDELADLGHLLAAAANVVVTNVGEVALLVLALDGLALVVDDGILGDDAVFGGIGLDDLELDGATGALGKESVALAHGAVRLKEVGLQEDLRRVSACAGPVRGRQRHIKDVTGQTLNAVVKGQDVYALAVFDVVAGVDISSVAELDAEVVAGDYRSVRQRGLSGGPG